MSKNVDKNIIDILYLYKIVGISYQYCDFSHSFTNFLSLVSFTFIK